MARITTKEYDAVVAERDKIKWKFNVLEEKVAGTQYKLDTARDKTRQLQRENNTLVGILTTLYNRGMLRMISDSMEDRLTCKCGASLRPFGSLRNFKTAK